MAAPAPIAAAAAAGWGDAAPPSPIDHVLARGDKPTIALIAHDAKKEAMVAFVRRHSAALRGFHLVATGTTGGRVADTGLPVTRMLSGPLGGDAQIAAMVAEARCHAVVFLVDPLTAHPHEPDVLGLVRCCNVHNVPLALNMATAEVLVASLAADTAARVGSKPDSGE